MIEDLPGVPLVDQLPAVRAIVEMIALICQLGALPLAGDRWAEIGKLRHGRLKVYSKVWPRFSSDCSNPTAGEWFPIAASFQALTAAHEAAVV